MPARAIRKKGKHYSERRDQILRDVIAMMLDGTWVRGLSHFDLAKKHKMHVDTAQHIATEAGRFLRLIYSEKEDLKAQVLASLDLGVRKALEAELVQYDQQTHRFKTHKKADLRALKDFLQLQAEVHGLTNVNAKEPTTFDAHGQVVGVDVAELNSLLGPLGLQAGPKPLPEKVTVNEQTSTEPATVNATADE